MLKNPQHQMSTHNSNNMKIINPLSLSLSPERNSPSLSDCAPSFYISMSLPSYERCASDARVSYCKDKGLASSHVSDKNKRTKISSIDECTLDCKSNKSRVERGVKFQ